MKPIDVGDIHNKHEDQFEKMLKGKLLNQKETLIKATTTGIYTKLLENTPFAWFLTIISTLWYNFCIKIKDINAQKMIEGLETVANVGQTQTQADLMREFIPP